MFFFRNKGMRKRQENEQEILFLCLLPHSFLLLYSFYSSFIFLISLPHFSLPCSFLSSSLLPPAFLFLLVLLDSSSPLPFCSYSSFSLSLTNFHSQFVLHLLLLFHVFLTYHLLPFPPHSTFAIAPPSPVKM